MCDLEVIGVSSIFKVIQCCSLGKRGQFPDESVKIKDTQIHDVNTRRTRNISHKGDIVKRDDYYSP